MTARRRFSLTMAVWFDWLQAAALLLTVVAAQGSAVGLESGLAYFELQGGAQGAPLRVAFGDSVATATGFTVMRVKLDSPPGELAVFSGNAHLERGNSMAVDLHGGQSVALNATDPGHYNLSDSIEPDSWDTWNSDRDQALNAKPRTRRAQPLTLPTTALRHGTTWTPTAAGTTFPARATSGRPMTPPIRDSIPTANGNWMATPGYGYIFVSGYPWGYLPYQCGILELL